MRGWILKAGLLEAKRPGVSGSAKSMEGSASQRGTWAKRDDLETLVWGLEVLGEKDG